MGCGGTTEDRGDHKELSILDITVQLESFIFDKYSDTSSPNYK